MKPFRHILCPIDFSDPCRRSLGYAGQLARDLESRLTVFHVVDTRLATLGHLFPLRDTFQESRQRAQSEMTRWKQSIKLPPAQWEVVDGIPHRAIVERTKQGDVDLLVMASHGFSGVERLLLGSVTEKVQHQIQLPILVVGSSPTGGSHEPFVAKSFRTILVAVDLGPGSSLLIDYASALARRYRSKLLALHVVSPLADVLGGPLWPAAPEWTRLSQELKTKRTEEMRSLVSTVAAEDFETEMLIWEGEAAKTILQLTADRNADLLVMGAHGRGSTELGWLGSTCHKVIRAAQCPVLAIRKAP